MLYKRILWTGTLVTIFINHVRTDILMGLYGVKRFLFFSFFFKDFKIITVYY